MSKYILYFLMVLLFIFLGLLSRMSDAFPSNLSVHLGDVFWASMVFFLFRVMIHQKSLFLALIFSILFSFGIEYSQLYQADWINSIRNTGIGGLILGRGFLWIDLLRYSIGILLAVFIDVLVIRRLYNTY
ncbi:hypothetical protein WQ54_20005 [Bacillus sp. SA1-12]|uniref:ribosomal maturation YjgA family protein n=1 Tax=Bacillus sp. SA1-12 TaxID=1455638 RepID=UPI000626FBB9|nr:DUF2809 domain-containing protein [Bacillus sp. SA1-12]KKI90265.1 hypothetical protein WQ54_20005 [Bacillus sp. SA1-12]